MAELGEKIANEQRRQRVSPAASSGAANGANGNARARIANGTRDLMSTPVY